MKNRTDGGAQSFSAIAVQEAKPPFDALHGVGSAHTLCCYQKLLPKLCDQCGARAGNMHRGALASGLPRARLHCFRRLPAAASIAHALAQPKTKNVSCRTEVTIRKETFSVSPTCPGGGGRAARARPHWFESSSSTAENTQTTEPRPALLMRTSRQKAWPHDVMAPESTWRHSQERDTASHAKHSY
eukprot:448377-Pleurochrysis_carterae.AAC.2